MTGETKLKVTWNDKVFEVDVRFTLVRRRVDDEAILYAAQAAAEHWYPSGDIADYEEMNVLVTTELGNAYEVTVYGTVTMDFEAQDARLKTD